MFCSGEILIRPCPSLQTLDVWPITYPANFRICSPAIQRSHAILYMYNPALSSSFFFLVFFSLFFFFFSLPTSDTVRLLYNVIMLFYIIMYNPALSSFFFLFFFLVPSTYPANFRHCSFAIKSSHAIYIHT